MGAVADLPYSLYAPCILRLAIIPGIKQLGFRTVLIYAWLTMITSQKLLGRKSALARSRSSLP